VSEQSDRAADEFFRKKALEEGYRRGESRKALALWYRLHGLMPPDREREIRRREVPIRPET
jgi:hypothetical protein